MSRTPARAVSNSRSANDLFLRAWHAHATNHFGKGVGTIVTPGGTQPNKLAFRFHGAAVDFKQNVRRRCEFCRFTKDL